MRNPFRRPHDLDRLPELADVDLEEHRRLWDGMDSEDPDPSLDAVLAAPHRFAPPLLHLASTVLSTVGLKDEAAFWFYVAEVRCRFDVWRCGDRTVSRIAAELTATFGPRIDTWLWTDPAERFPVAVRRAVEWDRAAPSEYEFRWINLHGDVPFRLGPGHSIFTHPDGWPAVAEEVREKFLADLDAVMERVDRGDW